MAFPLALFLKSITQWWWVNTWYIYLYDDWVDTYEFDSRTSSHTKIYSWLLNKVASTATHIFYISWTTHIALNKTTLTPVNWPSISLFYQNCVNPTWTWIISAQWLWTWNIPYLKELDSAFLQRDIFWWWFNNFDPAFNYAYYDPKSKKWILIAPIIQTSGWAIMYLWQLDWTNRTSFWVQNYNQDMFIYKHPQYVKIRNVSTVQYRNMETWAVVNEEDVPIDENFAYLEWLWMNNIKATWYQW